MKTNFLKTTIVFSILVITSLNVKAQVTIGSAGAPEKGMLLQLKTKTADATTNETVDETGGGIGFPRVNLVDKATLQPFITTTPTPDEKRLHTGTVVYNLSTSNGFLPGLYVWDGEKWGKVNEGGSKFFYMPSFCIELTQIGPDSFNLYDEYVNQFTKDSSDLDETFVSSNTSASFVNIPTHESGRLYTANELDFVVTYYDTSIMTISSIDTNGWMYYNVKNLNLSEKSFINVVLVVK
jgi:hypothetical protein